MVYLYVLLLLIALATGWVMTLLSMPGNWIMIAATAIYAYFMPDDSRFDISWTTIGILIGLALLAELLELAAGAMGAARAGGSKRGAVLAAVGSMVGALAGAFVGLPIPVVGSVIAAILFAGLGALGGAMLGESWKGRGLEESWKVGQAAFWGRLLGTLAKTTLASVMVAVAMVAALFP
ncbi:MAG TPA: DUF456 domain-containing protein [Pirellulales bacterium]|nr:DUF456 domain-containing protein [Pirellulales bacterium]